MNLQKKGHGEKFTRQKESAIIGLLLRPTLEEAAKFAHISTTTLWRWLQDPDFQSEWRQARGQAVAKALAQLQQATSEAVKTLLEVMQNVKAPAGVRVAAARVVLEMAIKATELDDFGSRLSALERAAEESQQSLIEVEDQDNEILQAA